MSEILPAYERMQILERRLANLKAGAGDYNATDRHREIDDCILALGAAAEDYLEARRAAN